VVNHPKTIGWPDGRKPVAPRGYEVIKFAGGLDYPRQALLLPNGDMLVAEARTKPKLDAEPEVQRGQALSKTTGFSANRITLLRDANRDGVAEQRFVLIDGLNQPFGMQYANGRLYVANTDGVVSVPFSPGQTRVTATPQPLVSLPAGGYNNHWTRNLLLSPDARTLYVSVGSASNVGEHGMDEEKRRAAILAIDLRTGRERLYASGLRNPVGMAWAPGTNTLWAAVNERDQLGDDIAPDYLVGVRDGGFYGWPYSYYGKQDPRHANTKRELLATTLLPDVAVGPHAAALGVAFAKGTPAAQQVAYVARHGSWNRSAFIGYDVLAVPFANGRPTAAPQPFLTGFVANEKSGEVYGRPVSVQTRDDGAIFVVDDAGDTVWLVRRTA
jgi:glucose/arabinose dehydrogenase